MKSILVLALFILSAYAIADNGVHSIVRGTNGEPHLVKLNSGEVKFIEQGAEKELALFEMNLKATKNKMNSELENKFLSFGEEDYAPTPVSAAEIQNIWNRLNPFMKRKSECSDRAHVWSWDEFNRTGTKSEKAFLLLTDSYIRRVRYKWWFHVAPMFTTTAGQKMVMDYQFFNRPVTFTEWKNHLVFSKRECVSDFRFLDYNAGADQTEDCYQKHEPMYFYIPGDIGNRENGRGKTGWINAEVNGARSRAFFKAGL